MDVEAGIGSDEQPAATSPMAISETAAKRRITDSERMGEPTVNHDGLGGDAIRPCNQS